jgi:hypothetical protein
MHAYFESKNGAPTPRKSYNIYPPLTFKSPNGHLFRRRSSNIRTKALEEERFFLFGAEEKLFSNPRLLPAFALQFISTGHCVGSLFVIYLMKV